MALRQSLELRQSQSLAMTPQLRQALKMLQAPAVQLTEMLASEVEKNPLLELRAPRGGLRGGGAAAAADGWEDRVPDRPSLHAHLAAQLAVMRLETTVRMVAQLLSAEIDEAGYLRAEPADVAARLGVSAEIACAAHAALTACEPTGVGARDLAECLRLQLREADGLDPSMEALLDLLEDAPRLPAAKLARRCGVAPMELDALLARLRRLDPRPGLRFSGGLAAPVVAEMRARPDPAGGWRVSLAPGTAPKLLIDRDYAARVTPGATGEAKKYLTACARDAAFLVRALDQRARTLVKVGAEIVAAQAGFLEHGATAMKPLTLREIAVEAEVHESTVSRVVADKFIDTPRGVLPLRVFFSSAVSASEGGEGLAAEAVRARIRALIEAEPAGRPLSDDALIRALKSEGVTLARRTAAKYREAMGIPNSTERRRRAASATRA